MESVDDTHYIIGSVVGDDMTTTNRQSGSSHLVLEALRYQHDTTQ